MNITRRDFLRTSALSGGALAFAGAAGSSPVDSRIPPATMPGPDKVAAILPDLAPARWIWYPSERTLANTFILFRREITLPAAPRKAVGWIAAESRYLLTVNGQRIQWGPPPSDPRWPEADPVDVTAVLQPGPNVLGATVLFYGLGDGTAPLGKPGFLFWLELEHADGRREVIVSDAGWKALLCRAWPAGQFKRWYLRSLQEDFDARHYPYGWAAADFVPTADWLTAAAANGSPNRPALATDLLEYLYDLGRGPDDAELRPRSIPLLRESMVGVSRLAESHGLEWIRPPREYFDVGTPGAFRAIRTACATADGAGGWRVLLDGRNGAVLTFELTEQVVGWPCFTIEAPAGTTVELLVHEATVAGGPPLMNSHFNSWTRFTCREGPNHFECFDFESLRWLQLHILGAAGSVTVREVGVRRRIFPWAHEAQLRSNEPALQRLFDASVNTLNNCAQETLVDGMARERQQYSGDGGHQLHAVHLVFGEARLPARFVQTFSQGMTKDGFFLDCWPAYDRLARLMERQLDLTLWGPLLDHGVGFNFDCWHHYNYTGDLDSLREPYPRLLRFAEYLRSKVGPDDLLPVEGLGVPAVWIDSEAYTQQRHKQCAFNLYAAAMLEHALAPLCRAFGDSRPADAVENLSGRILRAAVRTFWSGERGLFVVNKPWLAEEKEERLCDRSLATAVLFDQFPNREPAEALRALADCPRAMGFSYPCNAGWRLWALAKGGRADVVVRDFRQRWATMASVKLNNTLQEGWNATPDSSDQWSHCAVVPLYLTYHGLMGLRPLVPGFARVELRPQLADLEELEVTAHTVRGPIRFAATGRAGDRTITIELPSGCEGEAVLRIEESVGLDPLDRGAPPGHRRYRLPAGARSVFSLRFS